ncbi:MAG: excinuclease ABC subunit UvrA [Prosthecobacter sp.]|uniref:excinuclease ABC subunit UvrA n=1 Tax=Prosthecobacter sp. TaxID=1965333 RepID=UPI0025D11B4E|nr:excinuclease ABC subunit UvrA [Prosthecobacter sp.]MCF7786417.1 excinuclease ABC subunit UvrA [Prosthecobacter sp.]
MPKDVIRVRGARQHNLQNIDVDIPRHQLVVLTGVSGSGKSSLAFDTLFAEGQRRYVQSLSAYARQFLGQMQKPDVDFIEGLSPAVAIEQVHSNPNPRSTIATVTEIYDYLRVLYAVAGQPYDPSTGEKLHRSTPPEIADKVLALGEGTRLMVLSPQPPASGADTRTLFEKLKRQGFVRVRLNDTVVELEDSLKLEDAETQQVQIVIDRLVVRADSRQRLMEAIESALHWNEREVQFLVNLDGSEEILSYTTAFANPRTGYVIERLTPQHFSFNTHLGACPVCEGTGTTPTPDPTLLVPDETKSLADGAIKAWWARHPKVKQIFNQGVEALAKHFGAAMDVPFQDLPQDFKDALFYGTGEVPISTGWKKTENKRSVAKPFEGLLPEIARMYQNAESDVLRSALTRLMNPQPCAACAGMRLKPESLAVKLSAQAKELNIHDFTALQTRDALQWMRELEVTDQQKVYVGELQREIVKRIEFLEQVGLGYLALNRESGTLSGGEMQRIRLASQIGAGLAGVLYVLDEPSIGLHPSDNERLIQTLLRLRDLGNTVLVVEHDEATMRAADHIIELGPGAGQLGGRITAQGTPAQIAANPHSISGGYLSGRVRIEAKALPQTLITEPVGPRSKHSLTIHGATAHNLRNVTAAFPLGSFTCVTGPSGSGKSTLVDDILMRALRRHFYDAKDIPGAHEKITGLEHLDKVVVIDQSPIGRSPRSNPATYTGAFGPIRELFAQLPLARMRGYDAGRFSFNTPGGRCEKCEGDGVIKIDMHFLADVYVTCESCKGRRYGAETLEVTFKGKNIADVLDMTVSEAVRFFDRSTTIGPKLRTLEETGLGYIRLGQSGASLSGGEAQRIKLSAELAKRSTGRTLFVLDEPTTGLHSADIQTLLGVLLRLRDAGNTLIVIEHHIDVIRCADWIIDLGPGGGTEGGNVLATGTPQQVAADKKSVTGRFLRIQE